MKIYTIPFLLLVKPKDTLEKILKEDFSFYSIILYMLILNSIGPILSLYSLYIKENYPLLKTLTYSIGTYILDILSILIFSIFFSRINNNTDFKNSFKLAVFIYTPIWLSDIVDINQYLRPLSNLGLIYSLALIYFLMEILKEKKEKIFITVIIFLILYMLDGFIAELIITNPILKKLLNI